MAHTPVLLKEAIKFLDPKPGEFIVDGTVDGGGHSAEILRRVLPTGIVLGVDLDKEMVESAERKISAKFQMPNSKLQKNLILVCGNYANLPEILKKNKLPKADGLLLDLGFSSEQLEGGRGFSFLREEPLVMTYSREDKPVAQILRELKEEKLADIIFKFSGEKFSRRIAKAIKEKGKKKPITTTLELRDAILSAVPRGYEKGRMNPATRTFQALRIYANNELENLKVALGNIPKILENGGKVVIISFHSLEDRLIKNSFREYAKTGVADILTKKPVKVSREEMRVNSRSRSAKLRAIRISF